ncbi:hypothetical protein ACFSBZ_02775 [Amnibacterium flavum]|uniref:hypothetical protein n=1 Tax=Amnibacterium flavum TaxID=2173173 RepID=UPI00140262FE|nr:hypothetical protein [Amnibacterium flavum]
MTRSPSARQLRDDVPVPEIARLHVQNFGVYGSPKMSFASLSNTAPASGAH